MKNRYAEDERYRNQQKERARKRNRERSALSAEDRVLITACLRLVFVPRGDSHILAALNGTRPISKIADVPFLKWHCCCILLYRDNEEAYHKAVAEGVEPLVERLYSYVTEHKFNGEKSLEATAFWAILSDNIRPEDEGWEAEDYRAWLCSPVPRFTERVIRDKIERGDW